jgi:hypothetical protein
MNNEIIHRAAAALAEARKLYSDEFGTIGPDVRAVSTLAAAMLTASYYAELADAQRRIADDFEAERAEMSKDRGEA